jgi:formiminotetrahydrofolate cyclodeaminase
MKDKDVRSKVEQTFSMYRKELGSKEGIPGGGSAAALVGAMSTSLAQMVADIQKGKKKYMDQKDELESILLKAERLGHEFEELSIEDAKAFEPVTKAYSLPKDTEQEKRTRQERVDEALKGAAQPPLKMMQKILEVINLYQALTDMGIKGSIVNDIAVGVLFAKTTLEASYLNVLVNAEMLKDLEAKQFLEGQSHGYLVQGEELAETLYADAKYYLTHKKWPDTSDRGE